MHPRGIAAKGGAVDVAHFLSQLFLSFTLAEASWAPHATLCPLYVQNWQGSTRRYANHGVHILVLKYCCSGGPFYVFQVGAVSSRICQELTQAVMHVTHRGITFLSAILHRQPRPCLKSNSIANTQHTSIRSYKKGRKRG